MRLQPLIATLLFVPIAWTITAPTAARASTAVASESGLKGALSEPEGSWQAGFPGLRPGTNPANPNTYPFLPAGKSAPSVPVRHPHAHQVGINLAAHLHYTVTTEFPDDYWRGAEAGYPDHGQLTDGRLGSLSFTDPAWIGHQYQYVHHVTVDLLHPAQIRACSLDFLQNLGAGVIFPDKVQYLISQDGSHWKSLGEVQAPATSRDYRPQSYAFELPTKPVTGRYVRAEFINKVWAFMDEFAVYGHPGLNPKLPMPVGSAVPSKPIGYAKASMIGSQGIHNMVLVYTHGHGSLGTWDRADFTPMIASVRQGNHRHPLFDTVLFTPYSLQTSAAAWTDWLQDLFQPGIQLHALDDAMDKQSHGSWRWPRRKSVEKVVITIPSMEDVSQFGPMGKSGTAMCLDPAKVGALTATENKDRVIAWYLAQVQDEWRRAHFRHLKLLGFCWQPESLSVVNRDDAVTVQHTARLVHRSRLRFVWIPFYGAIGIPGWRDLGFDVAVLQPNVSFHWNLHPLSRLEGADRLARRYGMGMEMEAHWDVTSAYVALASEAQRRYFSYFTAGRRLGYQDYDVVKAWYLNSKTLLTAYRSRSPFFRRVYDCTVKFIQGEECSTP